MNTFQIVWTIEDVERVFFKADERDDEVVIKFGEEGTRPRVNSDGEEFDNLSKKSNSKPEKIYVIQRRTEKINLDDEKKEEDKKEGKEEEQVTTTTPKPRKTALGAKMQDQVE